MFDSGDRAPAVLVHNDCGLDRAAMRPASPGVPNTNPVGVIEDASPVERSQTLDTGC